MSAPSAYSDLVALAREQSTLASVGDLLAWDEETVMPRGGVQHRAEQSAALAGVVHDRLTGPRIADLIARAEVELDGPPDSDQAVNVRELRRVHDRLTRVPRALMEEKARVCTVAVRAWVEAREESDFRRFEPWLTRVVDLARRESAAIGSPAHPYDALLQHFEPGASTAEIRELLRRLRDDLLPLVHRLASRRASPASSVLRREFPVDRQRLFGQAVAAAIGFDLARGRLDVGAHPSCVAIGPGDVRLTARYGERNFSAGFFAVLHEVGHGLYDQGLDPAHFGTPLGQAPSLGLHESQARLWENMVGRGLPFWKHFYPRLRNVFHEALVDVDVEGFHAAINRVQPSLNRAEADEVTYNLHILIRFELEAALLAGDLRAPDVPSAWSEACRRHLGVQPANDAEGCLQDGHWASGMIGYFPTYALGNVYAAQLYARASSDLPGLDASLSAGDFSGLRAWLHRNVYRHGHRYPTAELIRRATGSPLNHRALLDWLESKYSALYGL